MAQVRKTATTALKIVFSAVLLYFVLSKIDFTQVKNSLSQVDSTYLIAALLLFLLSKVVAAYRLNLYFHAIKVPLSAKSNLELYLLGMFYNLFLPGGIGGDAYKGYLIHKKFGVSGKKVASALLLDRLSGLLLLVVLACILIFNLPIDQLQSVKYIFLLLPLLAVFSFWILNKRLFPFTGTIFWPSFFYSLIVQLLQLTSVYFLLCALQVQNNIPAYLLLFLISSIVAVLPLTIGGIGSREAAFYYGSKWLGLDENNAVAASMLFFLMTALVSLFGIIYHFKKIRLTTEESNKE